MSSNFLLLNDSKTEFVLLSSGKSSLVNFNDIIFGNESVPVSTGARNLGVYFDSQLSMETHIANVSKSCFFHLRSINRIRTSLSKADTEKLVHALISSRLDSCNSLLAGLPSSRLKPLVRVQHAACCSCQKIDHVTPILEKLHWLPLEHRLNYKLLVMVFKSLHGFAPKYLCDLVKWYSPNRSLRSGFQFLAEQKSVKKCRSGMRTSKAMYKDRAFENLGPKLFNDLPISVRSSENVNVFKSRLKTFLFKKAFNL